jgi:hypothetical protein
MLASDLVHYARRPEPRQHMTDTVQCISAILTQHRHGRAQKLQHEARRLVKFLWAGILNSWPWG